MQFFTLDRPATLADAVRAGGPYIGGGTDLLQLMKEGVSRPSRLVDLAGLLPRDITLAGGVLRIGGGVPMEQVATDPNVATAAPMIAEALLESASVQVRNLALIGGNPLQRTRCGYFRDPGFAACNKRSPGSGCAARGGENRILAVLGTSEHCIAAQPSDFAVTLVALRAELLLHGPDGTRRIKAEELHRLPGDRPDLETTLRPGEVIEAYEIPIDAAARNSVYLKVRDRASFEWALLSAAVGLEIAEGHIRAARVAMGGVGTKPWRMHRVEDALIGARARPAAHRRRRAARDRGGAGIRPERLQDQADAACPCARDRARRRPGVTLQAGPVIGRPVPRVDGRAKVTGSATYAAEFHPAGMVYGAVVQSTIAHGRITRIDSAAAERLPGVLRVLTHENTPKLPWKEHREQVDPPTGQLLRPLHDDRVLHQGQHVALVLAERAEAARAAAALVRVEYAPEPAIVAIGDAVRRAILVHGKQDEEQPGLTSRGDPEGAFAAASVKIDATYVMPRENQNPMEPHACIAAWEGDRLTLWDKTQWPNNCAQAVACAFGIEPDRVRVIDPFVGGAFGSSLRVWPHTYLAALAAREIGRPVKIELSRREYYGGTGCRPWTQQRVRLAADHSGRLEALIQEAIGETSNHEDYVEATLRPVRTLHRCANVATVYKLAKRATNTPNAMRAPGEATGLYAMECAMDELAAALAMDPVELRLRNLAERDDFKRLPFSSNAHGTCLREGARAFGWERREPEPRSMRDGRLLVGMGVASAIYPTNISKAAARATLRPDGAVEVATAASDMGPGTWTSMTQVAADALEIPLERVELRIGDSSLPKAPVHGGSMTMASVGHAVRDACLKLRDEVRRRTGSNAPDLAEAAARLGAPVEAEGSHDPGDLEKHFSPWAFGAVFAEVAVDPDTCETRVRRVTGAYGAGRIINPRLARSQCVGGFIMGIGQALMERTEVDERTGRVVNANLAEYVVPVLADTPAMEVIFVPEEDPHLGPLGVKGLGEIALCGIGPAIANAVYHATGQRIRDLPITPAALAG